MSFTQVDAIVGSTTYPLWGRDPYSYISLTGVGNPPIRRQKERGPQQHGSTDVGFLLDERMLNMALLITDTTPALVATARRQLAHILKPLSSTPIQLRVTGEDDLVRQIDCYAVGIVDFPNTMQERIGNSQLVVVQFEAADPIPYDPTLQNVSFDTSGGTGYQVPLEVPMQYSTGVGIDQLISYTYVGDWEVSPRIYITGPGTDFIITNETTGAVLDFTGTSIPDGDTWLIDLAARPHVVIDNNGDYQNDALTDESDLATWSIAADPEAPGGVNDIRVEVTSGATDDTLVRVEFYNKYPSLE